MHSGVGGLIYAYKGISKPAAGFLMGLSKNQQPMTVQGERGGTFRIPVQEMVEKKGVHYKRGTTDYKL